MEDYSLFMMKFQDFPLIQRYESFTPEGLYTGQLLHQKPLTQKAFSHQKLLHQEPFTPHNFTPDNFYKQPSNMTNCCPWDLAQGILK